MGSKRDRYIFAFSYGFLTSLYDLMMQVTMREPTFKRRLVDQARIEKCQRVLDLGCGTATLTVLIKKANPDSEVIGLDGDPKILEIARLKVAKAGLNIPLDYGVAFELPYPDDSFDRVISSMVFHHLTLENKARTLKEAFRVLRTGGELHVADFGKPQNTFMYLISLIVQRLEETSDNVKGLLPMMFRDVGFDQVEETTKSTIFNFIYMTMFGTVALYRARKLR